MAKQISGAVGSGGRNAPADVATIQYLLNCVPASRGGPVPELAIDGICGPKTGMAIRNFQRLNQCAQDGRVDPGGRTLAALGSYDPYPNVALQPMGQGAGKGGGPGGKQTGGGFGKQDPFAKGDPSGQGGAFGKQDPFAKGGGGGGFGKGDPFGNSGAGFGKGDPFAKGGGGGGFGKGDPFGNGGGGGGFGKGDPFGNGGQNPFGKTGGPGGKSSW